MPTPAGIPVGGGAAVVSGATDGALVRWLKGEFLGGREHYFSEKGTVGQASLGISRASSRFSIRLHRV